MTLLRPSSEVAVQSLMQRFEESAPHLVAHLQSKAEIETTPLSREDPIGGCDLEELFVMCQDTSLEVGLCVRALHAMTAYGAQAVVPLKNLIEDRRNKIRSAALRALSKVASKEENYSATVQLLGIETRRDVVLQLMNSLGHARFEAGLDAILQRLTSSDYRIRQGAHTAMRAWGESAIPAIEHAARKARPDKCPAYRALITELEIS